MTPMQAKIVNGRKFSATSEEVRRLVNLLLDADEGQVLTYDTLRIACVADGERPLSMDELRRVKVEAKKVAESEFAFSIECARKVGYCKATPDQGLNMVLSGVQGARRKIGRNLRTLATVRKDGVSGERQALSMGLAIQLGTAYGALGLKEIRSVGQAASKPTSPAEMAQRMLKGR